MQFSKFYKLDLNTFDVIFYLCAEERPFLEDYEPKEDNDFMNTKKNIKRLLKCKLKNWNLFF